MLKKVVTTGVAVAVMILSAQASAHQNNNHKPRVSHGHSHHQPSPRPARFNVNKEQREQATMIKQGIKTCQITPKEAQRLNKEQNRIRKTEKRMRHDGLQKWERKQLKSLLHNARVKINKLTKNAKHCRAPRWKKSNRHHGNAHRHNHGNNIIWKKHTNGGTFSISIGH